jgi:hypothetical protein
MLEYPCSPHTHNHETRKRRPETAAERSPKRARLTKGNLKEFEKMGKRPKKDSTSNSSRSLLNASCSAATSNPSTTSQSTSKTVPTTDSSFPRLAFDNGILDPDHSTAPENLDYHQERLDRARDTASPSESEYKEFAHRIRRAPNEMTMAFETSTLLKRYGRGYSRVYNQAFTEFPKNVGFNNGLSATQPDMVEGFEMTQFDPFPVRQELGGAAVPTTERDPLTLPHLAGEWKGPGRDMILAETQAAYDGACMVHGRNKARSFLKSPDPPGHAFVSTFTTDGTTLNTFAHYSSQSEGQVEYHQFPTSSSFLIASYEDFKKSRRRLRNKQDEAKETSEKLRDELIERWSANQEDPTNQLLTEYWASLSTNNQDESSVQNSPPSASFQENNQDESTVDSVYAAPSATYGEDEESYDMLHDLPPPVSLEVPADTAGVADCDSYDYDDNGVDPTDLGEYWTSFAGSNQHQSLQFPTTESGYAPPCASFPEGNQDEAIPITENEYTPPDAPTYSPMTPPYSSKEFDNYNSKLRKTRSRASAAVALEGKAAKSHPPPSDGRARSRGHKRQASRKGKSSADSGKGWE